MIRGTTPDYILTLSGVDLSDKTVYVTISQGAAKKITKTGDDLHIAVHQEDSKDVTEIAFFLTQEDTLGLSVGSASVQVRYIDENGKADATDIAALTVDKVLLERVIEYVADDPA